MEPMALGHIDCICRMWLVRNEYTRLNVAAGQACCFV